MFGTVKRIIDWCGSFKKNLYIGFVFSFLSSWFAAMPVAMAAMLIGQMVEDMRAGKAFDSGWILKSFLMVLVLIFLRFLFDYLRARFQESISYELIARDRLAVGDALKMAAVIIAGTAFYLNFTGQIGFLWMVIVVLLSFNVMASVEPIADSAHVLAIIDDALDHLDALKGEKFIDTDGKDIVLDTYDIEFKDVTFSYGEGEQRRQVLKDINFTIPQNTTTAIVGPSGWKNNDL